MKGSKKTEDLADKIVMWGLVFIGWWWLFVAVTIFLIMAGLLGDFNLCNGDD